MRPGAIQQLLSAVGLIAWGTLLNVAGRGRVSVLNLHWEGHQAQVREIATRVTRVLGVAAIVVGVWLALAAVA